MVRRTLTLRGVLNPVSMEIPLPPEQVFSYESAGTSRAWKVIRWSIWPSNFGDGQAWTFQNMACYRFTLYTDEGGDPSFLNADENRAIGWFWHTMTPGKEQTCLSPIHQGWELDPDHLVTGQLFIGEEACTVPSDNTLTSEFSYLIELEERTVSPAENIIQTLKGRGQDVSS